MTLFGNKKSDSPAAGSPADGTVSAHRTVLGSDIAAEGTLVGSGEVAVEGRFKGVVDLAGTLTVAVGGRVEADVKVRAAVVEGTVVGNVTASERVDVRAGGVIEGDILTPRITVAEGATLRGKVHMSGGKVVESSPRETRAL